MFTVKNVRGSFAVQIDEFLKFKRSIGYKFNTNEVALRRFDTYCYNNGIDHITSEVLYDFGKTTTPKMFAKMHNTICDLVKYQATIDNSNNLILPIRGRDVPRHVIGHFTEEDIRELLEIIPKVLGIKRFSIRGQCVFGLLATTGMRFGEVVNLDYSDVDFEKNTIMIRNTKNQLDRKIRIHSSVCDALKIYINYRTTSQIAENPFFTSRYGTRLSYTYAHDLFHRAISAGKFSFGLHKVRIHDLRFSFAINTIIKWYDEGINVNAALPTLQTAMGHKHLRHTIYYLEFIEPVLALAFTKFKLKNRGNQHERN